jgi:hypothetical protein
MQDYLIQKEREMADSWDGYIESVSSASANKRRREYGKATLPA